MEIRAKTIPIPNFDATREQNYCHRPQDDPPEDIVSCAALKKRDGRPSYKTMKKLGTLMRSN